MSEFSVSLDNVKKNTDFQQINLIEEEYDNYTYASLNFSLNYGLSSWSISFHNYLIHVFLEDAMHFWMELPDLLQDIKKL